MILFILLLPVTLFLSYVLLFPKTMGQVRPLHVPDLTTQKKPIKK